MGRGVSETMVANGEDVDAALLAAIQEKPKDGDAPEIDPFEAMKVIEQLSLGEVDSFKVNPSDPRREVLEANRFKMAFASFHDVV